MNSNGSFKGMFGSHAKVEFAFHYSNAKQGISNRNRRIFLLLFIFRTQGYYLNGSALQLPGVQTLVLNFEKQF